MGRKEGVHVEGLLVIWRGMESSEFEISSMEDISHPEQQQDEENW